MNEITRENAAAYVGRIGPSLGYDITRDPVFPERRRDVCAVIRTAENGSTYGYDTAYLLWIRGDGITHTRICDTADTKDYMHIDEIDDNGQEISVRLRSGGSFSGTPWNTEYKIPKNRHGIK